MFNHVAESSDSSPQSCDECCSCAEDEAYLDQVAAKNYEDALKDKKNTADPEKILRYNLPGINIPIGMRADSEAIQTGGDEQAEMERSCPFPPMLEETMVTDPIVVTSLGSDTTISASAEAIAILKQHKKDKRLSKASNKAEKPVLQEHHSGAVTPHMRPPPPTPPEYASLRYTLSTPNLPVFHHYTDHALLQKYEVERAEDPLAFDRKTAEIKQFLLKAKIERGGVGHLEDSEYSVDLASREDARKVQGMTIQRHRGMTETSTNYGGDTTTCSAKNVPESTEVPTPQPTNNEASISKVRHRCGSSHKLKGSPSDLPTDFNFAEHVAKYITSGSIRHQHSRKVIQDHRGTKTTLKTWIEITQEINVPNADLLTWEDVKTANRNAKAARKEMKMKIQAKKEAKKESSETGSDTDTEKAGTDPQPATEMNTDVKELLGAVARIKGTGHLTKGVPLSQYLTVIEKDIKEPSKDKETGAEKAGSGDESE
jgi:hypothetical protein